MDFDISKFEKNIERYNVKERKIDNLSGFVNVINHVYNGDLINEIDFSSFSIEDAIKAMEAMEGIALIDIDDEYFHVDTRNPFIIFKQIDEVMYRLGASENKIYESDEEEIFI